VAAHRVADERHPPPAEGVEDAEQVGGEVLGRVRRRPCPLALAVAALIEGDHVEPAHERGRDVIEPVGVGRAAVQKAEDGAAGHSPLEKVQAEAVDLDRLLARDLASEAFDG
jgi:hypothetical protein